MEGLPNPSPVQRIGAWLIGSLKMGCGLAMAAIAKYLLLNVEDHPRIGVTLAILVAAAFFSLGAWTFRLGFRKRHEPVSN
jgi:hypothetical protein